MVNKTLLLVYIILISSCFSGKNQYNKIRYKQSRFTIRPNSNDKAYKIIDTTKLYELIDVIDTLNRERMHSVKKQYLKFYANGRVGGFDKYDAGDVQSLDPRKANMAYYNYENEIILQFYYKNPQGGGLLNEKVYKSNMDTLMLIGGTNLSTYKVIELPKIFLIFTPDW